MQADPVARTLDGVSEEFRTFWTERHLASLVTVRADGGPHVVPVGVTLDIEARLARVICRGGSVKARNAVERGIAVVSRSTAGAGPRWRAMPSSAPIRPPSPMPSAGTRCGTGDRGPTRSGSSSRSPSAACSA